ncbi:MAG: 7-cyano-7-deazaguanine synthase QueC [Candidatus Alcyoniella australis]|nr:7-cyano-7-deazaguanine synthase QueC [Candidatus Alcyoniella australis]
MSGAVLLLSGGLDSSTCAAWARDQGRELYCLTVSYGQRHSRELLSAKRVAHEFGAVEHLLVDAPLDRFGHSALTDRIDVPKDRDLQQIGADIPITYVPARNTVLLSLALAYAESRGLFELVIGANRLDHSGYPDCRPEFVAAFEALAATATADAVQGRGRYRVHAPLMDLDKAQIIRLGSGLGLDYGLTWSCYDPQGEGARARPCGRCDSCILRAKGFKQAGLVDPLLS